MAKGWHSKHELFYPLRRPIYVFNSVVNTNLSAILSHRRSTTVYLEIYTLKSKEKSKIFSSPTAQYSSIDTARKTRPPVETVKSKEVAGWLAKGYDMISWLSCVVVVITWSVGSHVFGVLLENKLENVQTGIFVIHNSFTENKDSPCGQSTLTC